jgi:adenosylhomocysteine nucleosidase
MIAIIGAMEEEVEMIKKNISELKESKYQSLVFYNGMIKNKEVVLMKSGIGKVHATFATTVLFEHFNIELVINIGTAGGVKPDAEILDLVLGNKVCYHDVDVTAFNYQYGQVPECPLYFESNKKLLTLAEKVLKEEEINYHKGLIASGDAFIHNEKQIEAIKSYFPDVLAVEMEACAIGHICHIYEKPFIIMRALSDIAGKKSELSFDNYLIASANNSAKFVLKLLNQI